MIGLAQDPVVQWALHAGAALLFLSAALHKLRDVPGFRAALADYRTLPGAAVPAAAAALITAELAVGLACLWPATARLGCLTGAGLLLAYSGAVAWNLARGRRQIDCGCGGPGGRRPISGSLLARNAGLLGLLLLAALPESGRPLFWLDAVTGGGLLATGMLLYVGSDLALTNGARLARPGDPAWTRP